MKIRSWGAVVDSDKNIWMPVLGTNKMLKREPSGNISIVGELKSDAHKNAANSILKCFCIGDEVYLFSRLSYEMWVLGSNSLRIRHLTYCEKECKGISDIAIVGKKVCVFPVSFDCPLITVDLNTLDRREIPWTNNPYGGNASFIRAQRAGQYIYTATRRKDDVYICEFNTEDEGVAFYQLDVRMINCIYVGIKDYWAFVLKKNGDTVLQKYENGFRNLKEEFVLGDIDSIDETGKLYYFNLFLYGELVYFIPSAAERIYVYNHRTKEGFFADYPEGVTDSGKCEDGLTFADTQHEGNMVYIFPHYFNQCIKLNLKDLSMETIDFKYSDALVCNVLKGDAILHEGDIAGLDDLIKLVTYN